MLNDNPKPGQEKLLSQLCCEGDMKNIGAEFVLRNATSKFAEVARFEDKTSNGTRVVDIVLNRGGNEVRRECKSWRYFSPKYYSRTIKEFVQDITDVNRLEDMEWVFDAKGLFTRNKQGRDYLKNEFIRMLQTPEGLKALNSFPFEKVKLLISDNTVFDQNKVSKLLLFLNDDSNFSKIFK